MPELRWHPLLLEWVSVATRRQQRTFLPPREACPFCPNSAGGDSEVPHADWDIAVLDNRFPAFETEPGAPETAGLPLSPAAPAKGACEVVLYTPRHDAAIHHLSPLQLERLVDVWTERTVTLGARPEIQYVYIFENRGEEVGVTLSHPHGQIYGFPFIPPLPRREIETAERHLEATGQCLLCSLLAEERRREERVILDESGWVALAPFYARFPYEVTILPARHRASLPALLPRERAGLASAIRRIARALDALFDQPMPYLMTMLQQPVDGRHHEGVHLHIDFLPLRRAPGRLKYLASVETGAGTFLLDVLPERAAEELRSRLPHE